MILSSLYVPSSFLLLIFPSNIIKANPSQYHNIKQASTLYYTIHVIDMLADNPHPLRLLPLVFSLLLLCKSLHQLNWLKYPIK